MSDREFMLLAVEKALEGVRRCQAPFGACIVKDGKVVCSAHNTVWANRDSTAHAEVNAIRKACRKLRTIDLSGCAIYSTCEPCPMCFSAIHWARIGKVVYGCSIGDARNAGFRELPLSNRRMLKLTGSKIKVKVGFMRKECLKAFFAFRENVRKGKCRTY